MFLPTAESVTQTEGVTRRRVPLISGTTRPRKKSVSARLFGITVAMLTVLLLAASLVAPSSSQLLYYYLYPSYPTTPSLQYPTTPALQYPQNPAWDPEIKFRFSNQVLQVFYPAVHLRHAAQLPVPGHSWVASSLCNCILLSYRISSIHKNTVFTPYRIWSITLTVSLRFFLPYPYPPLSSSLLHFQPAPLPTTIPRARPSVNRRRTVSDSTPPQAASMDAAIR